MCVIVHDLIVCYMFIIKISAFGRREFALGSLYNSYSDKLVGIEKPWSQTTIDKFVTKRGTPSTSTYSIIGNSLEQRIKVVDISLDLTLSLLWGLAKINLGTGNLHCLCCSTASSVFFSKISGIQFIFPFRSSSDVSLSFEAIL